MIVLSALRRLSLRLSPFAYAAIVLVVGMLSTSLAALSLRSGQENHASSMMDQELQIATADVSSGIRRYVDAAESLTTAMGAQSSMTAGDFQTITESLVSQKLPGAASVGFTVPSVDADIEAIEASWRAVGAANLHLDRTPSDMEHRFVVLTRTLDNGTVVAGRDVSQISEIVQAMDRAKTNREVTGSQSFVLTRDRSLPKDEQQQSMSLIAPVFGGGSSPDAGVFRGWLAIGVRSSDFAVATLNRATDRNVNVSIEESNEGRSGRVLTSITRGKAMKDAALIRHATLDVAGQSWLLTVVPTVNLMNGAEAYAVFVVAAVGLVITLLLAALVWTLSSGQRRALTKVEQATAELLVDRKLHADLLSGISELGEGVVIAEGRRLVFVNRAMSEMSGYTEEELLAMPDHLALIRREDRDSWARRIRDIERGDMPNESSELSLMRKDGTEFPIEIVSKPLHVGGSVQRLGVIRDIRGRRQIENALAAHAEALVATNKELVELEEMRSDFLAAVSHDFRTPLTAIMGFVELALDCDDETQMVDIRLYLDRASNAASVLHNRVESFLEYSRAMRMGVELELTSMHLRDVMTEILEQMAPVLNENQVHVEIEDAFVSIEGRSFNRVVENLLTNAIKYSPQGSVIDVRAAVEGDEARIYVADRGSGIAPEHLERIFDSYFRAEDVRGSVKGSGVGLAVARQLIEAMNGRVWATNRDGGGAVFCVALPLSRVASE